MNNFMPSKAELKRRHVATESFCADCGHSTEDVFHVVIQCSFAKRFWEDMKAIKGRKLPILHPTTWAAYLLSGKVFSKEDAALSICGAWSLWTGRNGRRHGKK